MRLRLIILTLGRCQGKEIPVRRFPFIIGRDASCQLRVKAARVSRRHCEFSQRACQVRVRDLGSKNGTFLNGQPVTGEAELRHGDWLRVGPVDFDVRLEANALPAVSPQRAARAAAVPVDRVAVSLYTGSEDSQPSGDPGLETITALAGRTATDLPPPRAPHELEPRRQGKGVAPPARPLMPDTAAAAGALLQTYLLRKRQPRESPA